VGIECRTKFIVRELGKEFLTLFGVVDQARGRVAGESGAQTSNCVTCPVTYACRSRRGTALQIEKSMPKASCIELIDGKGPDATLGAPQPASQPIPAAASGVGEGGVHDLD